MTGQPVEIDSIFGGGSVLVDPWAVNLLADDWAASNPWTNAQAVSEGPPPKMFSGGSSDLPAFTSSGIDPQLLLQVPGYCRHAIAAEPDRSAALAAFEEHSSDPYAIMSHPGLTAAIARVRTWAAGSAWDPLAALRASEDARLQLLQRNADLTAAFERGGAPASDALLAQYAAQDAAQAQQHASAFASAMDAMGWQDSGNGNIVPRR
jgi:hypothetical protein